MVTLAILFMLPVWAVRVLWKDLVEHGLEESGQGAGAWTGIVSSPFVSRDCVGFFWRTPTTLTTLTTSILLETTRIFRTVLAGVRWVRARAIRVDVHVALRVDAASSWRHIHYILLYTVIHVVFANSLHNTARRQAIFAHWPGIPLPHVRTPSCHDIACQQTQLGFRCNHIQYIESCTKEQFHQWVMGWEVARRCHHDRLWTVWIAVGVDVSSDYALAAVTIFKLGRRYSF